MIGSTYEDLFATKGPEYMLILAFLTLLIFFWRFLNKPGNEAVVFVKGSIERVSYWFNLPEDLYYHYGHSWARKQGDLVRVGIDDFAQRLIGRADRVDLPEIGSRIGQGQKGWSLEIDSRAVDMLSPVTGEVVAVNREILTKPELLNEDPYGEGWLAMVSHDKGHANLRNLLTGTLARTWMNLSTDTLRLRAGGELGAISQDGGLPVTGIAKTLSPEGWDRLAGELLLTREEEEPSRL